MNRSLTTWAQDCLTWKRFVAAIVVVMVLAVGTGMAINDQWDERVEIPLWRQAVTDSLQILRLEVRSHGDLEGHQGIVDRTAKIEATHDELIELTNEIADTQARVLCILRGQPERDCLLARRNR